MFSWKEIVALSLIGHLKDPELVRYFMSIVMPLRDKYMLDDAQSFHISLRECFSEDIEVNKCLPITSSLQLYNHSQNMSRIKYFTPGFIRRVEGFVDVVPQYVDEYLSEKVEIVETLLKDEFCESNYPVEEINSALEELHGINDVTEDDEEWLDIPYLTTYNWRCRFGDDYKYIELVN
jgi:hypothetical protein